MFKRVIASVSLFSIVMAQAAQAMEVPETKTVKSYKRFNPDSQKEKEILTSAYNITNDDVENNIRLLIEEEKSKKSPQPGMAGKALVGAIDIAAETIGDWAVKAKKSYKFIEQIYNNEYDEIAGEAIDIFLSSYVGEGQKNFFRASYKDFDPGLRKKIAMKLADKFLLELTRVKSFTVINDDGSRGSVYHHSLFHKLFDWIPVVGSTAGSIASFFDNGRFRVYLQEKLVDLILPFFDKFALSKADAGRNLVGAVKYCVEGESSFEFSEIWEYLSPHINYNLRYFLIDLIQKQKGLLIEENEKTLWYGTVPTSALSVGGFLFSNSSSVLYYTLVPFVYSAGTKLLERTKKTSNAWLDKKIESTLAEFISVSHDEYLLYWLNKGRPAENKPSDIEMGFSPQDYKRLEELNSHSYLSSVATRISNITGVTSFHNYLVDTIYGNNIPSVEYCTAEKSLQAYRQFMLLKEMNPKEANKILQNLEDYPSYERWKSKNAPLVKGKRNIEVANATRKANKQIQGAAAILLKELSGSVKENALKEYLIKKFLFEKIFPDQLYSQEPKIFITQILSKDLQEKNAHISFSKDAIYGAFLQGIMASSIEEQDFIIPWVKEHKNDLRQCFQQVKYHDLFPIQIISGKGAVESPPINGELIKSFFKTTSTDITWTDYAKSFFKTISKSRTVADSVKDFIKRENISIFKEQTPDSFKGLSLTEGHDEKNTNLLYKRYVNYRANNKNFFEILPPEITKIILNFLGDLGIKDNVKDNYLFNLSLVSRQLYKLSLDTIDERKYNGLFDLKILDNKEIEWLINNFHDMVLIDEAYRKLKLDRLTYTLCEILGTHLQEMKVVDKIKLKINAELSQNNGSLPSLTKMAQKVNEILNGDPEFIEYHTVNEMIRPLRGEKDSELDKAYNVARGKLILEIAQSLLAPTTQSNSIGDWLWSMVPTLGSPVIQPSTSNNYVLTKEDVNKKFEHAKNTLDFHDKSSKGVRAGNLFQIINLMEFTNPADLSIKDLIRTHQHILENKLTEASASDKKFVIMYGKELSGYKSMSPCFRNWLFDYKYSDLIQAKRKNNEIIIELINPKDKK